MLGISVNDCSSRSLSLFHTQNTQSSHPDIEGIWWEGVYSQLLLLICVCLCFFFLQWRGGEEFSVWADRSRWRTSRWYWQSSWVTHSKPVSTDDAVCAVHLHIYTIHVENIATADWTQSCKFVQLCRGLLLGNSSSHCDHWCTAHVKNPERTKLFMVVLVIGNVSACHYI